MPTDTLSCSRQNHAVAGTNTMQNSEETKEIRHHFMCCLAGDNMVFEVG